MDSDDSDEAHLAFLDENHQASDPLNVNQSSDEDDDDSSTTENTDKAKGASGNGRQVVNLADVLDFLRSLPSASKFVSSAAILTATAVDLADPTSPFALSLRRNAHIQHEAVRDEAGVATGEFLYAYQSKFNIKDKQGLINLINRCEDGVMYADLIDSYDDVGQHMAELMTAGDVISVQDTKGKDLQFNDFTKRVLFPRNGKYLVELEAGAFIKPQGLSSTTTLSSTTDLTGQIRRGEAVYVEEKGTGRAGWFRIDTSVNDGPLVDQPSRAKAPASVSFNIDMSLRNDYLKAFEATELPLDGALPAPPPEATASTTATTTSTTAAPAPCIIRRHGCTKDVKNLFLATVDVVPWNDTDLLRKLVKDKIEGYSEDTARRKNARSSNMSKTEKEEGTKKKARSYIQKSMRTTNAHLAGTKIGEALNRSVINARREQQEETARKGRPS